eukprot:g13453.t1
MAFIALLGEEALITRGELGLVLTTQREQLEAEGRASALRFVGVKRGGMAINEPPAARRHKKDRSSIGSKTADRSSIGRTSIGSKPLSFHQKKGRFARGGLGGRNHKSAHLDRIRKDALDDFTRATHERSQSVHQMAAMYASSTRSAMSVSVSSGKAATADGGGRTDLEASLHGVIASPLTKGMGLSGLVSVPSGGRTLESIVKEAQSLTDEANGTSCGADGEGEEPRPLSPVPEPIKSNSFSSLSNASDERARDLKKIHVNEALDVTSHRVQNVKDIANAFKGESRPENVEVFHKRHKEQEAEYRHKVHLGKETLKKTSQGTDAMYNFVLKLNLATTEGKALFMRKWAIGRIANGESITPREGWKFLQSLGIDVPKASTPGTQKPADTDTGTDADADVNSPAAAGSTGDNKAVTPPARGRGRTRHTPGRFGRLATGDGGGGGGRDGGGGSDGGKKQEAVAWEVAMSQAVGAVVRPDADARAPKLGLHRRRRSGSEPRKAPTNMPRAPDTCRAPRSKFFFFGSSDSKAAATPPPPAAKSGDGLLLEEEEGQEDGDEAGRLSAISPTGSAMGGLAMTMEMWREEAREGRPQSQAFGTRGPSLEGGCRASVSPRLSGATLSPPRNRRSGGGVRISMNPRSDSPGRFSLSPGRAFNGRSPFTPTEKTDRADASPPLEGGLQLPQRLFAGQDAGEDGGSEDRFELSPVVAAGPRREGFGSGGAGAWAPDISRDEEEDEKVVRGSAGGRGPLDDGDDPKAKAERLSMVSVVGAGTLSNEEEEEEEAEEISFVAADYGKQSGGSPPSPEHAVVHIPALDATATPAVPAQEGEAGSPQQGAEVLEPTGSMPPPPLGHDEDGEEGQEQDSVLMDDIARMDEQSVLLEGESDLMGAGVAIDSDEDIDKDANADADDGGDRHDDAEITREGKHVDPAADADSGRPGGSRFSLDDSGYAPDAENTASSIEVVEGNGDEAVAVAGGEEGSEELPGESVLMNVKNTAEVGGTGEVVGVDDDDAGASEDEDKSGCVPSGEEGGRAGEGRRGLQRDGQSAAGEERAASDDAAAAVEFAVRETVENLTAGVAILVGDEQFLSCSEVLSELQSDAGDCDEAIEGNSEGGVVRQEDGPEGGDIPSRDGEVGESQTAAGPAPHSISGVNLKIAVRAELQEEEPPVPRLQWGVNNIPMGSPLNPSRYDSGGSREPSTCLVPPCRLTAAGLLHENDTAEADDVDGEGGVGGPIEPLTIEVDRDGDAATSGKEVVVSSPWGGASQTLLSPLSPLSVGSSPEVLGTSELRKPERWGGRLSALSEGRESRASDGSTSGGSVDGKVSLNKARCMTGGTEETASPSSRRVSTESLPPTDANSAAVATTGDDDAGADGADANAADNKHLQSQQEEAVAAVADEPGIDQEARGQRQGAPPAASPAHVLVTDPLAVPPEAALDLPLPATPVGSPDTKVSPAAPASSSMDPSEVSEMVLSAGLDDGGEKSAGDDGLAVTSGEIQGALALNTPVSNPYQDFDELHDREHFGAAVAELNCKTPGGVFNFCRPRSGTVYESAKGPGPGFFSEAAASSTSAGANGQEHRATGAASPVGVSSDVHQGCTIA